MIHFIKNRLLNTGFKQFMLVWCLLVIVIGVTVLNELFGDEKPNPEAIAYFFKQREVVQDSENAWYAVVGLTSPEDVADIHEYGLRTVNKSMADRPMWGEGVLQRHLYKPASKRFGIEGEIWRLYCWIGTAMPDTECAPKEEAMEIISKNKLLLSRFGSLYQYPRWQSRNCPESSFMDLPDINRLMLAHVRLLMIDGRESEAVQMWLDNYRFWGKMVSQPMNHLEKSIVMIIQSANMDLLPIIIESTHLSGLNLQSMASAIQSIKMADWNIDGMLREQFGILEYYACAGEELGHDVYGCGFGRHPMRSVMHKPHLTINRFYAYVKDHKTMMESPYPKLNKECEAFVGRWNSLDDISTTNIFRYDEYVLSLLIFSSASNCHLIEGIHRSAAKINLLKLYLAIKKDRVTQAEIESYIGSAPIELRNPVSGEHFYWDKKKGVIGFTHEGDKYPTEIKINLN